VAAAALALQYAGGDGRKPRMSTEVSHAPRINDDPPARVREHLPEHLDVFRGSLSSGRQQRLARLRDTRITSPTESPAPPASATSSSAALRRCRR